MRIIQVILAFYPCQIWGGPPQNTLILSKGLQARGHEVEILTTNVLDFQTHMSTGSFRGEWEGVPVTYLHAYWWGKRPNSLGFILAPDLWRYRVLIAGADIVHIHGYRHFLFIGSSLLAMRYGVPYIAQTRGALPSRFGRTRLKRVFDQSLGRFILSKATRMVALSDAEVDDYVSFGCSRSCVVKIFNPFDPSVCSDLPDGSDFRRRYGIRPDEKVVLFLARLHERKGLELLIRAVASLARQDIRLCIVGPDGGFRATAENLIAELGLNESVIMTGPLYGREKFEAYRAADVYVLPAKGGEGLPTTVLEACYAGVPIIITRATEIARVIEGRVGVAIDYDVDQLKGALVKVLDNPEQNELFRQRTTAVLQEFFDIDMILDSFEGLYKNCLVTRMNRKREDA
jgi:glycosyltransferase involved in cell wall biosynthesis